MDNKTTALVSYITIIGWLISFFSYKGQEKDSLVSYHLRQSFGLFVAYVVYWFLASIIMMAIGHIGFLARLIDTILYLGYLAFFVLMIIGILNASKGEEKPLPIIGQIFEGNFNFIP